ncbi:MAG: hypothetical protein JSS76_11435 [Bacteroidetes bacterium]|nr:hypothetical protein [Bacteroidota bacterium]
MSTYYIPISSENLAHYYSKALILPAALYANRKEDIQNRVSDSILLSNKKWINGCDCSLEIVLTEAEMQFVGKLDEVFSELAIPIPITRVKAIFFLTEAQKETTLWNINNTTAYVPQTLVHIDKTKDVPIIADRITSPTLTRKNEFRDKINRYDTILGGFAFMKLGGKNFMNFSENYFSTLSFFNKVIEDETRKAEREGQIKFSEKYYGLFSTKNESTWSKWLHYIFNDVTQSDVEKLAGVEGIKVQKTLGFLNLKSINTESHLYEIAVLSIYGDKKPKSLDNLVTDMNNGLLDENKKEDISFLVGLHNGYSKLRNKYRIAGKDFPVKYTFESKLDYYTIESLYQFAFFGIKGNYTFNYLDSWCPKNTQSQIGFASYNNYKILDTTVISSIKPSITQKYLTLISKQLSEVINDDVKKWSAPYLRHIDSEGIAYFENLLAAKLEASFKALESDIQSDYKNAIQKIEKKYIDAVEELEFRLSKVEAGLTSHPITTNQETGSVIAASDSIKVEINDEKIDIVQDESEPSIYNQEQEITSPSKEMNFALTKLDNPKPKPIVKLALNDKKKVKKKNPKDSSKKSKDELF